MSDKDKIVKSAITAILALTTITLATPDALAAPLTEKCYGMVKAGMNDCQTEISGCAVAAKTDSQADAFIFVPNGLCNKIVGAGPSPVAK